MFIGIQNNTPTFLDESKEALQNLPCVTFDEIQEVDFAEMYAGKIYLTEEELITAKQDAIRSVRNQYLEQYVDSIVSNPLRWADMSEDDQNKIKDYRRYLLDYTEEENWYEQNPKTWEEYNV